MTNTDADGAESSAGVLVDCKEGCGTTFRVDTRTFDLAHKDGRDGQFTCGGCQ